MELFISLVVLVVLAGLYFLPIVAACIRCALHLNGIIVVNLFLGWTLIGWVAALAWAVTSPPDRGWQLNRVEARQRRTAAREGGVAMTEERRQRDDV